MERVGLPQPPPWRQARKKTRSRAEGSGRARLHGFVSRPEIQKLNRNSIYIFVNGRLIRDRLVQHALTEAYRNIMPPTVFPVVLLFLEMPARKWTSTFIRRRPRCVSASSSVAARFHARFGSRGADEGSAGAAVHDGDCAPVRPPVQSLTPGARELLAGADIAALGVTAMPTAGVRACDRRRSARSPRACNLTETASRSRPMRPCRSRASARRRSAARAAAAARPRHGCSPELPTTTRPSLCESLASLKPLGQIRESFILAVNRRPVDHRPARRARARAVRKILRAARWREKVETPATADAADRRADARPEAVFAEISDELQRNGFEVEPFGSRTIAVKTTPAGVEASQIEHMLHEMLDQFEREEQSLNLEKIRTRIAASIACHAAIKVNMPLEQNKMEWLLAELAKTEHPMSCPHGRPVVLRYSVKDIQKGI